MLEAFYKKDPMWTVKTINYLSDVLKMSKSRIYKWGYERSKKCSHPLIIQKVHKPLDKILFSDLFGNNADYNTVVEWL